MAKTKVVYILGTGRNGSTALGIALGNLESVFYAGELHAWTHFNCIPGSANTETIEFWKRIQDSIPRSYEYIKFDFRRYLEHHKALFRLHQFFDKDLLKAFEECNCELFAALSTNSQCRIIVDSSHYPLRLFNLRRVKNLDIKVILIVRDPRAVIKSFQSTTQKAKPMGPLRANIFLLWVSLFSQIVFWTFGSSKRFKIKYEDFASQPMETIEKLAQFLDVSNKLTDLNNLSTGNVFQGNRLKNSESIAIQFHKAPDTLSKPWQFLTTIIQFPLLVFHKYLHSDAGRTQNCSNL